MPSKLKKAIAAVKDQTSISLAKVKTRSSNNSSSAPSSALEVAILKATSHDEVPMDEHQVHLIVGLVSADRAHASACARALGRRISRTRNWAVALKSLLLVLRLLQDGDPHFPKEVLAAMKRGYKILNLSSFAASGRSASWHFTAFVRTFALYLDERLRCFLTGKLVHRRRCPPPPLDMKPPVLLDRVGHWQRLLDRAVGTRPTGPAKSNRLVHASLYAVVQETFDLYRDISDGLALLLDSFFHLQHASSARAYEACVKASRQFAQLAGFYDFCKGAGVGGRTSDYPSVTGMSEDLLDTLHDFLRDQQQPLPTPPPAAFHGRGTSLEELIGDISIHSDPGDEKPTTSVNDLASVMSDPTSANFDYVDDDQSTSTGWELALLEAATLESAINSDPSPSLQGSSIHPDNPFLQDLITQPPTNGFNSNEGFFKPIGHVQPTFRAHGSATSVDFFDGFGTCQGNIKGNAKSVDLPGDFNNGDTNSICLLGFHANFKNPNSELTVSNGSSLSD